MSDDFEVNFIFFGSDGTAVRFVTSGLHMVFKLSLEVESLGAFVARPEASVFMSFQVIIQLTLDFECFGAAMPMASVWPFAGVRPEVVHVVGLTCKRLVA